MPRTVLVVEDNPITRKMMRLALESERYDVLEAGDARTALDLAKKRPPDLVLQDYVLPDMDGLQLAEGLRALPGGSDLPIVVVTGMVSRIEELRARAGPSITFLPKPIEPSRLVEIVRTHLEGGPGKVGQGRRVLVVDDEPLNLKLAALRLRDAGFEVETASSGEEALQKAPGSPPDAILSDVLMPGMDGFVLCAAVRQHPRLSHLPVVLLSSAYAEEADRKLARDMGASALLIRTPDLREAIGALTESLQAGPPPAAAVETTEMTARHRDRMQIQLERQLARNEALLRQGAIQAAALSVIRALSEALARPENIPNILGDVLVHCLDAAGLSTGLLYLIGPEGRLRLQAQTGLRSDTREEAADWFGHPEMLGRILDRGEPVAYIPGDSEAREPALAEIASRMATQSVLVVPFVIQGKPLGALVMASGSHDLSERVWVSFSQALAVQFGQTVALGQSLSRGAASEARYRTLMERANDAILVLDPGRRILEANHQAEELLGRRQAEILGRPYDELVESEERESTLAGWTRLLAEGTIRVEGCHFLRADGTRVAADISSAVVKVGEETVVLSILRDITERLRAEAELRATKERLQEVVSANPAVIYVLRTEGDFPTPTWVSANMERFLGYTVEESLAPGWWFSGLHPQDRDAAVSRFREVFVDGKLTQEYRFLHRDGTYRWVRDEERLQRDATGAPIEIVGSWSDITERKHAELKLAESEEQFREVFAGALDAMVVTDDEGRFVEANPAACELYGCPRAELLKRKVVEFAEPGFHFDQVLAAVGATGHFRASHRVFRPDGTTREVDASTTGNVVPGRHFSALRDMTEHRQLEGQFRQAQKMEAVGHLAGGVAHDFNNLLGVITGYSELLKKRLEPEHVGQRALEQIRGAADRAAVLTRQLLAFSRKQVLEPKVLDLNEILAGVDKMLRRLIGEDVQIQTRFAADLWQVKADPGQIEQVIMNLAVNARDAMPKGGHLILETANTALDAAYAHTHSYVRPGPYVMLAVSDNGCGMDAETLAHMFEPFFTTKGPGKGTGLGLATVFGIVKQSGGHLNVYSEPGRGSTFKVYLPRTEEVAAPRVATALPSSPPGGTETILVVEDAEALRVMIREILQGGGYTVLDASHPAEALATATAHPSPIDLMLTDVVLPRMSGPDLAASLTGVRPGIRVLYMSGYTADAIGDHGVLEPGTNFIPKPFTAEALLNKLRSVLDAPR
jgi:PAS domain S-box-containing protein